MSEATQKPSHRTTAVPASEAHQVDEFRPLLSEVLVDTRRLNAMIRVELAKQTEDGSLTGFWWFLLPVITGAALVFLTAALVLIIS